MSWIGYFIKLGNAVLLIVAWGLLASLAANAATRLASRRMAGILAVTSVLYLILAVLGMNGKSYNDTVMMLVMGLSGLWFLISNVYSLYLLSLIYRNNTLDRGQLSWLMLISLSYVPDFMLYVVNVFSIVLPEGLSQENMLNYMSPIGASIFGVVYSCLLIVAYWQLAHCEAFTGKFDGNVQCTYSSGNRYFWAPLITVLFAGVAYCIVALNANNILNLITT